MCLLNTHTHTHNNACTHTCTHTHTHTHTHTPFKSTGATFFSSCCMLMSFSTLDKDQTQPFLLIQLVQEHSGYRGEQQQSSVGGTVHTVSIPIYMCVSLSCVLTIICQHMGKSNREKSTCCKQHWIKLHTLPLYWTLSIEHCV